ncbi:hypothetical protein SAMN05660461_3056 [Chitinophaga ginsengisegetis]|uniref:Uncharacterized protein n=1 Tax=Chitinophaga ginsengisegetis TaxID=393003 RepID=A0A1T5NY29_9BACT|nr:hypothetical protein [Chitinophaga ginsengisegetis]MDR6646931.1 hypothetical protein [Chitinophaga ginsengisegetis]MDR6653281.1 hypothetical protein [Chitinophaga ginsengisegetis]SKD05297.1 hypothetical protein SAMN05660461_3056 [Chitinophaga ginsengisegetis]
MENSKNPLLYATYYEEWWLFYYYGSDLTEIKKAPVSTEALCMLRNGKAGLLCRRYQYNFHSHFGSRLL